MKYKLILASQSPRRKELLGFLNIPFTILPSEIDENSESTDPVIFSQEIALAKAIHIKTQNSNDIDNAVIVSADTIVVIDQKILGKPKGIGDAKAMLLELSGREHSVFTSVALLFKNNKKVFTVETKVTFDKISSSLLDNYLKTNDSLDKAGSYGIQGEALTFISKVDGSYSNVVGFPLSHFVSELSDFLSLDLEKDWKKLFI